MKRRGFLGSLLGLAASPVVAKLEPVVAAALAPFSPPSTLTARATGGVVWAELSPAMARAWSRAVWAAAQEQSFFSRWVDVGVLTPVPAGEHPGIVTPIRGIYLAPQSLGGHA